MDETKTRAQAISADSGPVDSGRRAFFTAALVAGATITGGAIGAEAAVPVLGLAALGSPQSPISWVHGNSATILAAHDLEMDQMQGNARVVRARSWTRLPMHFAIPAPVLDSRASLGIEAIWLRLRTEPGARISALSLHDCELTLARVENLDLRRADWADVRVPLTPVPRLVRSLGVTLDCDFADTQRVLGISAVGCEFRLATA